MAFKYETLMAGRAKVARELNGRHCCAICSGTPDLTAAHLRTKKHRMNARWHEDDARRDEAAAKGWVPCSGHNGLRWLLECLPRRLPSLPVAEVALVLERGERWTDYYVPAWIAALLNTQHELAPAVAELDVHDRVEMVLQTLAGEG